MKGIAMMLKALGVEVNPQEIEQMIAQAKTVVPKLAPFLQQAYNNIDARLKALESQNREILALLRSSDADTKKLISEAIALGEATEQNHNAQ